ncbi:hypothetical protein GCM10009637_03420 [Brevibacterium luteolum]
MGKHSAPKTKLSASIADFFRAFGPRRHGRHSDIDEEPASAASILRSTKRMPNWAALAVPTAAVASLAVSGLMLAPADSGTPERVVFSSKEQPRTGPASAQAVSTDNAHAEKLLKDWDDAVSRSKEKSGSQEIAASPKPTPPPPPPVIPEIPTPAAAEAATGASTENEDKSSDSKKDSSPKRDKSEPKQNTEASGQGGTCKASYYNTGHTTANGESYDPMGITAAHKKLPFNSKVKVTNKANGKSVVVRINDRGPFVGSRCLDLSEGAMKAVGGIGSGVITVDWEVL